MYCKHLGLSTASDHQDSKTLFLFALMVFGGAEQVLDMMMELTQVGTKYALA
jgi:hypothetical protein